MLEQRREHLAASAPTPRARSSPPRASARARRRADRSRPGARPARATPAAASTSACRPTRRTSLRRGAPPPTPPRAAARRSGRPRVERSCGPQRTPDVGSASTGQPAAAASAGHRARPAGSALGPHTITPRGAPRTSTSAIRSTSAESGSASGSCTRTHGHPSSRPCQSAASSESSRTGASGSRSGKFRCTGPGRPPRAVAYARQASARWCTALSRPGGWLPTSTNHLANAAVQLELVDRLPGADVAQLGRPVGGQDDQRHARLVRLDHRGHQVRGRAARRAGDGHRAAGRLGQSERHEPRRALVQHRDRLDARIARQRQHERRVARPGRRDRVSHPAARQLVHERLERRQGGVHWDDRLVAHGGDTTCVAFVPGFMQRGDAWGPIAARVERNRDTQLVDLSEPTLDASRRRHPPGRPRRRRGRRTRWAGGSRSTRRCAHPARSAALVLVGATPGIEDAGAARARAARPTKTWRLDGAPTDRRDRRPLGAASRCSPPRTRELVAPSAARTACARPGEPRAQCCAPRARARCRSLWDRLHEIAMPGAGRGRASDDAKYADVAERMAERAAARPRRRSSPAPATRRSSSSPRRSRDLLLRVPRRAPRLARRRRRRRRGRAPGGTRSSPPRGGGSDARDARRRTARASPARRPATAARTRRAAAPRRCPTARRASTTGTARARAGARRAAPRARRRSRRSGPASR